MEPNIAADGTSDSSTETQGENTSTTTPVVDGDKGKSPPKPLRERMNERFAEVKRAGDSEKTADAVDKKKAGDVAAPDGKAKDAKAPEAKSEETIPLTAFKARLGKETEKRKALQDKLDESDLEQKRLRAKFDIAVEELKREREARAKGTALDPKDEQLRDYDIEKRAREAAAKIDREIEDAKRARASNEGQAEFNDQFRADFDRVLSAHPVLSKADLIAELRKPANVSRQVADVARERAAIILENAKKHLAKERPASPDTVKAKAGGSHSAPRTPDLKSMRKRFSEVVSQLSTD